MMDDTKLKSYFSRDPWPHQLRGFKEILSELRVRDTLCVASPTGSGKSMVQAALVNLAIEHDRGIIIYNARRPLTAQIAMELERSDIQYGARAASLKDKQDLHAKIQVGSIQTDVQRVLKQECWSPHKAGLVIVDEAHMPEAKSELAQQLYQLYLANGAKIVGMTGTPLGVNHIYSKCISLTTNSELRACGAHVWADTYAPTQLDISRLKPKKKTGEYSEGDIIREIWNPAIVGYAYRDWRTLNPDCRLTMVAAPGVEASVWVANEWLQKGHRVAHIDANECFVNGERYAGQSAREQILDDARKGEFDLITNNEVLTAGIDIPNLYHVILLRPFGSLANYVQMCGRVIRYSPETPDRVLVTDHCGGIYSHGDINADRPWEKLFDMTDAEIRDEREKQLKDPDDDKTPEPITCPQCGLMREGGVQCPGCGHKSTKRERIIVQEDGTLGKVEGRVFKPLKKPKQVSVEQKKWDSLFWACHKSDKPFWRSATFKQLAGMYKKDMERWPDGLKRTPRDRDTWNQRVRETDWRELR